MPHQLPIMDYDNFSFDMFTDFPNDSYRTDVQSFDNTRYIIYRIVIPLICSFGVVSNGVNLGVFAKRWGKRNTSATEKAAMVGLLSLAISDLLFCLFGLPAAFLELNVEQYNESRLAVVGFYYVTYRTALMNMALYASTWCIVLISIERYIAVCHPFQARLFIRVWKTALLHLAVFLCAILISLPEFLKYSVIKFECGAEYFCYFHQIRAEFLRMDFRIAYRILWVTVGTLVPLGLMSFCNIRLLVEIYRSKTKGLTDPDRYCTTKLTLTVAGIISMFLVLVCPTMVISVVETVFFLTGHRHDIFNLRVAMLATNVLQAVKFSINFLWYCTVNSHFRQSLECAVRKRSWSRTSSDSPNKVEMTLLK